MCFVFLMEKVGGEIKEKAFKNFAIGKQCYLIVENCQLRFATRANDHQSLTSIRITIYKAQLKKNKTRMFACDMT